MPESSNRISKAYDNWAEIYDTNQNKTRDLNAKILRSMSLPVQNKRVLEVGCGTGINSEYFAEQAASLTGLDFSEKMLIQAKKRVNKSNTQFLKGDITEPWEFKSNSFDFISANLVLEHIEDLSLFYSEAFRVLNSPGHLYIAELHPYRQLQDSQAKFVHQETGKEILVDAFLHPVSQFINEAIAADFKLVKAGEHKTESDSTPRLLTLFFQKS